MNSASLTVRILLVFLGLQCVFGAKVCEAAKYTIFLLLFIPGDLKTRKRTGTSCQIEIHFSIKTTKFLFKYTLLCSQIYDRFIICFIIIKHNHKVSASFIKEKQTYK